MAELLRGTPAAAALTERLAERMRGIKDSDILPTLGIIRVGERADDLTYERAAIRRAESLGIQVRVAALPQNVPEGALLSQIRQWNADPAIHGILLMRPLPAGLEDTEICEAIAPEKDVDGVTRASMAGVYAGTGEGFAPCTAEACLALLDHYGISVAGKRVAVVGRSLVIGRPVAALLTARDATVTLCHSRTADLPEILRRAELVVAALGRAEYLRGEWFSPGQTVLDVGIHFSEEKQKLVGDVAFEETFPIVGAITPVPGGVGSMTTAVLCRHVVEASERANRKE